jgi:isoleucyl-tRNA synthetase
MLELDRWVLHKLQLLIQKCRDAYEGYQFHVIYHSLNEFCIVALSSFYLDIVKDRLYCEKKDGVLRRSAQTAMWTVLDSLSRIMAPILSFTSEEIWQHAPAFSGKPESIFLVDIQEVNESLMDSELAARWDKFQEIRSEATKILEKARADKAVGNSLEAILVFEVADELKTFLNSFGDGLNDLFIVSKVEFGSTSGDYVAESDEIPGLKIGVLKADSKKCERCWKYDDGIGGDKANPSVCPRCSNVVS